MTEYQTYPVSESKDVLIPTRDGTQLAANLYRPEGVEAVPAIVVYFPYLKDSPSGRGAIHSWQTHFAQRGYACLTIDVRGFGGSEGVAAPPNSLQEKEDGRDALSAHGELQRHRVMTGRGRAHSAESGSRLAVSGSAPFARKSCARSPLRRSRALIPKDSPRVGARFSRFR